MPPPKDEPKPPKTLALKLLTQTVKDIRHVAEIEGKDPSQLVEELLGDRLVVRVKKHWTGVERLRKLDAERESVKRKAREKAGGEQG